MPKAKSHKGLLKRITITGTGKVKFRKANNGHLRSKKAASQITKYRRKSVAKAGDMNRLEGMLKRPLTPAGRDVRALRLAAKAAREAKAAAAAAGSTKA
jgi:large subunit ribosomal protein L35